MRLLSRGLTKITASLALLIVMISTSVITWSLITATGEQTYTTSQGMIRLEAVMYDPERKELIINLRLPKDYRGYYSVTLYRSDTLTSYEFITSNIITYKKLDLNLMTLSLKLNKGLATGNYHLKLEIQDKILEYRFNL
ncbi:MAG: hypothetical protein QXR55_03250 [Sulfolobales archaeon]